MANGPNIFSNASCFIVGHIKEPMDDRCIAPFCGMLLIGLSSEPIQSRCAVLRYTKLTDTQLLARLTEVCTSEQVSYTDDGLEAVIFTAQGDMRQVPYVNAVCLCVAEFCALTLGHTVLPNVALLQSLPV